MMDNLKENTITNSEVDHPASINAIVLDKNEGSHTISDIIAIRIHSRDYVLLIMKDYAPALGKIDGDISFVTTEGEINYKSINGFYKHQQNQFVLLISSDNKET